jgi:hypothetical protein
VARLPEVAEENGDGSNGDEPGGPDSNGDGADEPGTAPGEPASDGSGEGDST